MIKNMAAIREILNKNGLFYIENADMSLHSTMRTGGSAVLMIFPKNEAELYAVCKIIKNYCQDFYITGSA